MGKYYKGNQRNKRWNGVYVCLKIVWVENDCCWYHHGADRHKSIGQKGNEIVEGWKGVVWLTGNVDATKENKRKCHNAI